MVSFGRKSWPVTAIAVVGPPAVGLSPIAALTGIGVGEGEGVGIGVIHGEELGGQSAMRIARAMGDTATRTTAAAAAPNMTVTAFSLIRATER
jgi:hypothetical protein